VVQRCVEECRRQYLVITAQAASERCVASLDDIHVHAALQHASESVTASLHFAMHFARCNVAIISRIYEKYEHAVACGLREGCADVTRHALEQQFLQEDCAALLTELRDVLSSTSAVAAPSSLGPLSSTVSVKQPFQPTSPARALAAGHVRSDSNAVLQAARSRDLPLVASISSSSSAALTGAVKSAVETNDTVALSVLLSTTAVTGSPRCSSARCTCFSNSWRSRAYLTLLICSDSPTLAPGVAPDENRKPAASAGPGSIVSTLADDMGAGDSLLAAIVNGDIRSVQVLLRHGVGSNCRNGLMATPLAVACEAGLLDVVRLLLEAPSPPVRAFDVNLRRPLHLAALSKRKDIVVLLLAAGANVQDPDINGNTALHYATLCDATGCMEVLLQAGSQVSAQNKDGSTALHLLKTVAAAKLLLDDARNKDALPIRDSRGRNVLHMATLHGDADLLKFLLDVNRSCGCPLSLLDADDQGSSVLHNSCKSKSGDMSETNVENMTLQLLQHADESTQQTLSNLTDANHMTALHLACIHGQLSSCKALLLAGADPMLLDKDGMMALSYACLHSHRKVGEYLMSMMPRPELPAVSDNEALGAPSQRSSMEQRSSRDSSSRTSRDATQEPGDGDESPLSSRPKLSTQQQQKSQWFEGKGHEAIYNPIISLFVQLICAQVDVTFSVEVSIKDEHSIFMVGDVQPLGQWDPARAVLLTLQDGGKYWRVTLKIKAGSISRYKFLIAAESNGTMNGCVKRWESLPEERFFEVPGDLPEGAAHEVAALFMGASGMDGPWLYKWTQLKLYFGANLWAGNEHTVLDAGPENGVRLTYPVYGFEPRLLSVRCANGQFASLERPRRSLQLSHSSASFDVMDLKSLFPIRIMVAVPLQKDDVCVAVLSYEEVSRSMYGCCNLPLLAPLLSVVGAVSLKYVVATPFVHAGMRGKGVNSR
jgi:ankyrin repeat protein